MGLSPESAGELMVASERIRYLEERIETYERLLHRFEARDAVVRVLVESDSIETAAESILRIVCDLSSWDFGAFWLVNDNGNALECLSTRGGPALSGFDQETRRRVFPLGVGLPGRVWSSGQPEWISDLTTDEDFPRLDAAIRDRINGAFAFPICSGNDVIGVAEFFSRDVRPPDEMAMHTFGVIGVQIGLFIKRIRAEQESSRRARLSALRADVASALSQRAELRDVLQACAGAVVDHLGAAFARIWTLNAAGDTLELQASAGLYTHIDGPHGRVPVGAYKIGWIAAARQPHISNSVVDDPRVTDHAWARREGMQAFAGYPLLSEGRLVGVLATFSRSTFHEVVLEELGPIAEAIAQFLDRRRAELELHRSEALKAAMLETSPDAIVAMSHTGHVLEFSPAAERLFGLDRTAAIGRPLADLIVPPAFRDAHRVGLARFVSTRESRILGRRLRLTAQNSAGIEFPVEVALVQLPGLEPPVFAGFIHPAAEPDR